MTTTDKIALALVAALLLTMPLYAIVARGRALDPEIAKRPTTVLFGYWVRDWLMWVIGPMERAFVRAGITPDFFNILGALLGLAAGMALASGALSLGGWLILLGGAADIFDGRIARARGLANDYGAFLDSTLDRFAETFTFIGLAHYFSHWTWPTMATALALGASLLVSYTRARGESVGVSQKGGLMQRAERLVLLALGALLDGTVTAAFDWRPGTLLAGVTAFIGVAAMGTALYRTTSIAGVLRKRG
ncbi:MAG TPA: CDP-alcohol phosphatidyltransferase family protein [Gemmatimonadaceae bacterium]|jgi:CDP-diacylglycerol--glycerol-3-phosphate 3-phosphatidyltransferase|nr:CDP-alcohol phosphatidyltransferase family protein [Gemmatimonadaceae bacterium]